VIVIVSVIKYPVFYFRTLYNTEILPIFLKTCTINRYIRETHATYPTVVESRLQTLMFPPLNSDGSNFMEWINDAKTILSVEDLARTLITPVASTSTAPAAGDDIPAVCK
jgi:hypothetical protein